MERKRPHRAFGRIDAGAGAVLGSPGFREGRGDFRGTSERRVPGRDAV